MDSWLNTTQLSFLRKISHISKKVGIESYLVGGTVRDILLGRVPVDLDLAVVGNFSQLKSNFGEQLGGKVVSQSQFGTIKVEIEKTSLDIAVARKESYSSPGALPTVTPGSINDDLARRDLSINSMAVFLNEEYWGDLLDPFNGHKDLQDGIIKVIHDQSFVDDATRILRALRYARRLQFRFHTETELYLKRDLEYLSKISGDRLRRELELIFREPQAIEIAINALDLGILRTIHPALECNRSLLEKLSVQKMLPSSCRYLTILSILTLGSNYEDLVDLIDHLKMNNSWASIVKDGLKVKAACEEMKRHNALNSDVFKSLENCAIEAIKGYELTTDNSFENTNLRFYLTKLRNLRPVLTGTDIIELGVPQGPLIGELLDKLLIAKVDEQMLTREQEVQYVLGIVDQKINNFPA